MKKLIEAGYYGRGLVRVNDPLMVERYNGALRDMEIEPTKLTQFDIDGAGWSPQIAEEKQNVCYLCHGAANTFLIIITPDQRGKPVYHPYYSFDRELIEKLFRNAAKQIATITEKTALWVDLENDLAHYRSPADLLLVESLKIKAFTVGRLMTAAREQRDLVSEFRNEENAWADQKLRKRIIESAKAFGDLRFKSLDIKDISFTDMRSFHSQAFGGVFVFRDLRNDEYMLIIENPEYKKLEKGGDNIFTLEDKGLVPRLLDEKLVEIPNKFYAKNPVVLENLKECMLMDVVFKQDPNAALPTLPAHYKKLAVKYKDQLPEEYFELERYIKAVQAKSRDLKVSKELGLLLLRPSSRLDAALEAVVWTLLVKLGTPNIERLYSCDKERFYAQYVGWPENKKDWAILHLKTQAPQNSK